MTQLIRALCKNSVFGNSLKTESRSFIPRMTAFFSKSETNVPLSCLSSRRYCVKSNSADSAPVTKDESSPYYVYVGSLTQQLRFIKRFSISTSALGCVAQPALMQTDSSVPLMVAGSAFIFFFTVVTPILLHLVAKRYVIDVVYDSSEDTYTAHMMAFFGGAKPVTFKPGEAQLPLIDGMFTTMEVRGIPMLVDVKTCDIEHYSRMLGFDKPIDFKSDSAAAHKEVKD